MSSPKSTLGTHSPYTSVKWEVLSSYFASGPTADASAMEKKKTKQPFNGDIPV